MAKITILEKDLTKASFQASPTDIAYVPGLSIKEDATKDPLLCKSVVDFEKEFGTMPEILNDSYVTWNSESFRVNFNAVAFKQEHKHDIKYYYTTTDGWYFIDDNGEKQYTSARSLRRIGISIHEIDIHNPFKNGDWIEVHLVYDLSYIYAKELIQSGIPVVYQVIELETADDLNIYTISQILKSSYYDYTVKDGIMDRGEYSIKYLTSGGYPSFLYSYDNETFNFGEGFASKMLTMAGKRGDFIALIDANKDSCGAIISSYTDEFGNIYTDENNNPFVNSSSSGLLGSGSLWDAAKAFGDSADYLDYGAMFTPWFYYNTQASYYSNDGHIINQLSKVIMPPSFAYLITLAKSIRTSGNWQAIAGVARGGVPYFEKLYTKERLSNNVAEQMQPRNGKTSVNAITNIKPYGYLIWGNRTMKNNENAASGGIDGLTATSFLNIRNMVSDIKKTAYNAAKQCIFEQNSDVLWVNFCSLITPLLDRLVSGQGLSNYKIIKQSTKEKAKLKATIIIYPIYAVEEFEITIELSDKDVSVI